jgi:preprotein translocase subunit Sss1
MVRPEILRKRLNKLDEYLAILRKLRRYERDEFLSNAEIYGSAVLSLGYCNRPGVHQLILAQTSAVSS